MGTPSFFAVQAAFGVRESSLHAVSLLPIKLRDIDVQRLAAFGDAFVEQCVVRQGVVAVNKMAEQVGQPNLLGAGFQQPAAFAFGHILHFCQTQQQGFDLAAVNREFLVYGADGGCFALLLRLCQQQQNGDDLIEYMVRPLHFVLLAVPVADAGDDQRTA